MSAPEVKEQRVWNYQRLAADYAKAGLAEPTSWKPGGETDHDRRAREDRVTAHLYDLFGAHPDWPNVYHDECGGIPISVPDDAHDVPEPETAMVVPLPLQTRPQRRMMPSPGAVILDGKPVSAPKPEPKRILAEVARATGVAISEIRSGTRRKPVHLARSLVAWRMRYEREDSLPAIGRFLDCDHTSALHNVRHVDRLLKAGRLRVPGEWGTGRGMEAAE